jgi:hypothetical protein
MKVLALISLPGAWFELRSSKIFGTDEKKGFFLLSPAHNPLIVFGILVSYYLSHEFLDWINWRKEDNKEKYIEEEGLVDYWDALKAEKDKP